MVSSFFSLDGVLLLSLGGGDLPPLAWDWSRGGCQGSRLPLLPFRVVLVPEEAYLNPWILEEASISLGPCLSREVLFDEGQVP